MEFKKQNKAKEKNERELKQETEQSDGYQREDESGDGYITWGRLKSAHVMSTRWGMELLDQYIVYLKLI